MPVLFLQAVDLDCREPFEPVGSVVVIPGNELIGARVRNGGAVELANFDERRCQGEKRWGSQSLRSGW